MRGIPSMAFVACGINHKTAPLALREHMAQHANAPEAQLHALLSHPGIHEVVLLSTCNRTEIYCEMDDSSLLLPLIAETYALSESTLNASFYQWDGYEGVRHVLRVANGVDSMMIGEPQILGQMKQAYQKAVDCGAAQRQLGLVFPYVFSASKRIRHQSGIGNNPISVASAAVRLIGKRFKNYTPLRVFIIGSGEMAALVAKYLQQNGVTHFTVASRTIEASLQLATKFQGTALTISDIPYHLPSADVVISATACPLPFITKSMVAHALEARECAPMFFLDLAVPRDIEPTVGALEFVDLFNIDDLQLTIEKGLAERHAAAAHAEQLIHEELDAYIAWLRSLRANHVISDYRNQMQALAQLELQRATKKLNQGHCQYTVMNEFCERLVNKLTHTPTVGLRQVASDNHDELLSLAHTLFNTSRARLPHEEIT
jgi:glutamyl-tRNA reductase